ncbi:hypothetical protein E4T42_09641 [Aureobasidium subglaciale]|nr:hypothetical protein E4T38_09809 [Aureobasidium subglaciale]KAI5213373.1 hypothetical protein E4T40_09781 [Aureobasidium subglaciale]KAI5214897.1 hypothetical protein E4T41_09793 [Aureobasidium subglaciale]KAI5235233.1 hypothetical protein E4T43_09410 [Aureobasidium subglaciale]KAI5235778.1 hypothetical protein E4T42_09641 [Aureobasidium subglaciale]
MLLAITFLILIKRKCCNRIQIMYLALIILPLLGSIVSGFFGRNVGISGAQLITCSSVITTTTFAIVAFFEVGLNNIPVSIHLFK